MEKNIKKKECLYAYNWVALLYSRDWYNIVNQLYFNKKGTMEYTSFQEILFENIGILLLLTSNFLLSSQ